MAELNSQIKRLPPHARKLMERLVAAARPTVRDDYVPTDHWLVDADFHALFGLKLAMYHVLTQMPVNKKTFEYLLVETAKDVGLGGARSPSGTATVDIRVGRRNISCKTEGKIHGKIHISKFCEIGAGPWRTPKDLFAKIQGAAPASNALSFEARIRGLDKLLVLRHDVTRAGQIRYELLDVKLSALRRILDIPARAYAVGWTESRSQTIPKSFNVRTPCDARPNAPAIVVKFDGGGERKLTLTLPLACATRVATWSFDLDF